MKAAVIGSLSKVLAPILPLERQARRMSGRSAAAKRLAVVVAGRHAERQREADALAVTLADRAAAAHSSAAVPGSVRLAALRERVRARSDAAARAPD